MVRFYLPYMHPIGQLMSARAFTYSIEANLVFWKSGNYSADVVEKHALDPGQVLLARPFLINGDPKLRTKVIFQQDSQTGDEDPLVRICQLAIPVP